MKEKNLLKCPHCGGTELRAAVEGSVDVELHKDGWVEALHDFSEQEVDKELVWCDSVQCEAAGEVLDFRYNTETKEYELKQ